MDRANTFVIQHGGDFNSIRTHLYVRKQRNYNSVLSMSVEDIELMTDDQWNGFESRLINWLVS